MGTPERRPAPVGNQITLMTYNTPFTLHEIEKMSKTNVLFQVATSPGRLGGQTGETSPGGLPHQRGSGLPAESHPVRGSASCGGYEWSGAHGFSPGTRVKDYSSSIIIITMTHSSYRHMPT